MEPTNQAVIASLTDFVTAQLPEWYGQDSKLDLSGVSLQVFPYSFFLSIPVMRNADRQTLLAKIKRQPDVETLSEAVAIERLRKPARDEFEMTQKIWDAFVIENSHGCTAVRPVGYLEQWNAVVMEKVEGKALKELLLHPKTLFRLPSAKAELLELIASSARWLRVFHDRVSGMQEVPFLVDEIWMDVDESLERLERYSEERVNIEKYRIIFRKAMEEIAHLKIPVGIVHDDFHYSNILVEGSDRVCAIDNAGDYRTCAYVDLATLITDPQTRTLQIMTGGFYIPSNLIENLEKEILQNYFGEEVYPKEVVDFFCALAILNKWSEGLARFSVERRRKMPTALLKWIESYFSKRLFGYL